jgi:4-amino-4-deoxy-L-arabinose transferase-like glycosyltransferase
VFGLRCIARQLRSPVTAADTVIFLVIVAVAATTRLAFLDLVEFSDDEATIAGLAISFVEGRSLPLVGNVSSVGIHNPPGLIWLLAIPVAFSHEPALITGFIGLLGVGAVLLCYRLCDQHFDRRTAQVAALLFAASPWAVTFSRKIWEVNALPFFTLLLMGSLFRLAAGRGPRQVCGVALWLAALSLIHFSPVALIPSVALALALHRRRLRAPWVLAGLMIGAVLWLPYGAFQLTHGWPDLVALRALMANPPELGVGHFSLLVRMVSKNLYYDRAGSSAEQLRAETPSFDGLYAAEGALFLAGLVLLVGRLVRTRGRAPGDWRFVLLLLWLVGPPVFFIRHSAPVNHYYLNVLVPVQFIIIGLLFSTVAGWLDRRPGLPAPQSPLMATHVGAWHRAAGLARTGTCGAMLGLISALVATQLYSFFSFEDFIARSPPPDGHSLPLRYYQAAVDQATLLSSDPAKAVYVMPSEDASFAPLEYLAQGRQAMKPFDGRSTFVFAADGSPTLYLVADPAQPGAQLLRERFANRLVRTIGQPESGSGFELYRLNAKDDAELFADNAVRPIPRTLANGMRLVAYDLHPLVGAGSPIRFGLFWQVVGSPPGDEDYAFFNHLIDENGRKWGQADGLDYPPPRWSTGELVVSWFTVKSSRSMPSGTDWIESGVYRRSDLDRLELRADDGSSDDRVRLGPLTVVAAGRSTR